MELGVRVLLVTIALGLIVAILLDGYRKIKRHRNQLRFKLDPIEDLDHPLPLTSELSTPRKATPHPHEARFDTPENAYQLSISTPVSNSTPSPHPISNTSTPSTASSFSKDQQRKKSPSQYQDVIMLNLVAPNGTQILGDALLKAILLSGMKFGSNAVFHYQESDHLDNNTVFSLVNLLKPGTFELDSINTLKTPGICIYMPLPGPINPAASFETFLLTAHKIAKTLNLEIKDELHRPLSETALLHARSKALAFSAQTPDDDHAKVSDNTTPA